MSQLRVLCSGLLSEHGFRHGFSTRPGGVSEGPYAGANLGRAVGDSLERVEHNRGLFAAAVGYPPSRLFELSQVHGRVVRCVEPLDEPGAYLGEEGDGLVAGAQAGALSSAAVVVGVRTADCVPLLLADPETRCVAAVHAGWRGTALDIAGEGVRALCARSDAPPSRLIAGVFPHIRACCFEVSDDVARTLQQAAPAARSVRRPSARGAERGELAESKPYVDLLAILRAQLAQAGLRPSRIDAVEGCTRCEPARFFSYRRDGQRSGRHLAAIVAG